jgi:hypothetical protein
VGTGTKEDESSTGRVWAVGFHHVTVCSRLARVLKLMNHLFNYPILGGGGEARGKPRITETANTESANKGARLYSLFSPSLNIHTNSAIYIIPNQKTRSDMNRSY